MSGIEIGNLESLHTLVFSSLEFLFRYLPLFLILFYGSEAVSDVCVVCV